MHPAEVPVRALKNLLRIIGVVALSALAGELLLFAFGFPNGIQVHETDLRTYDDELVYRLRPGVLIAGKRTPYFVHPEIRTNSMGLRDREFAVPKPAGRFRILSLGDSYAFGWGVASEETYAQRLEQALNADDPGRALEVVNAGVPSYESWRELALLDRLGPAVQPDLVICQVADNDLGREGGRWKHADLPVPSWALRLGRSSRLATALSTLASSGLEGVRELRAHAAGEDTVPRSQRSVGDYMRELAAANDSAFVRDEPWTDEIIDNYERMNDRARGAFVCLLLPNRYQIYAGEYRDAALGILEARLARRGVRALNLCSYLRARNSEPLCLSDTHPNTRGHQLIADTLAVYLKNAGLVHR